MIFQDCSGFLDFLDTPPRLQIFLKEVKQPPKGERSCSHCFQTCSLACRGRVDKSHRTQALVFLISRLWVRVPVVALVSLSKTLNRYCIALRMGRKAVGPVCCVTHVQEPSALIAKRRGSPRWSWFDWLHIAPQHLVNQYMVLCKGIGLILRHVAPHTL